MTQLINQLTNILVLPKEKIIQTVKLLQEDNTIPFIARYRKEQTGNLNEEQIRQIKAEWERLTNLDKRRQSIISSIENQGKLTDSLTESISTAKTLTELEDLYQPFRQKKRTRAMVAREKGLEPFAWQILNQVVLDQPLHDYVKPFLSEQVTDVNTAIAGACDIAAEIISENATIRLSIRENGWLKGKIFCTKAPDSTDDRQVYAWYYQFSSQIKHLRPHQVLAINRGEREKVLKVQIAFSEPDWRKTIHQHYPPNSRSVFFEHLNITIEDCAKRLLLPSIERDLRRTLTENADTHAIQVFSKNLHSLLTQPPLADQVVLAIDPGFRTGSKIAVVDPTGKLLDTVTIYPHPPQNNKNQARQIVEKLVSFHNVSLVVIGNGTASRETEAFIAEITRSNPSLHYLITSEAGASVYSASTIAQKEYPEIDVSIRGAISIARRVQDPLAELVKIEPKAIGVGLYQHDINQAKLTQALDQVVESVVNNVGVDVNTASAALLTYVSGIGPALAENIINHRETQGHFINRLELLHVPGMGPKSYQQSAGFLRIRNGENPLDFTAIHPESYPIVTRFLNVLGTTDRPGVDGWQKAIDEFIHRSDLASLADTLGTGLPTLEDILIELVRPGRDPRKDMPQPILRKDVIHLSDLTEGMTLKGTVRNIVDFGAFIDIGVKIDGLLHRSKIEQGTAFRLGDIIEVKIINIDLERERIALEMRKLDEDG